MSSFFLRQGRTLGACALLGLFVAPLAGQAQISPGPQGPLARLARLQVLNNCADAPNIQANAVACSVQVNNTGTANSTSPLSLAIATAGSSPTVTYQGTQYPTFPCSTPTGGLPATISCSAPLSLTTGTNPGHGGGDTMVFIVPRGATLRACAIAHHGAPPFVALNSSSSVCAGFTRPVGPR